MEQLLIRHSGPLQGTVTVNGAKNAVLPIMAACLLTEEPSIIENVPHVTDVLSMLEILRQLGVETAFAGDRLTITPGRYRHYKGKDYIVLGVARHSETQEELVVYRQYYVDHGLWVRPKAMFLETVTVDGRDIPRFEFIGG